MGFCSSPPKTLNAILSVIALLFFTYEAKGDFTGLTESDDQPQQFKVDEKSSLFPNERSPEKSHDILKIAPRGVHIAVGNERGLFGAGLNLNATHVLLVDQADVVVRYNRINILLLSLAQNRLDYLHLRTKADFATVRARLAAKGFTTDRISPQDWQWWQDTQKGMSDINEGIEPGFRANNYLVNDPIFLRIQELALAGRIEVRQMDLSNKESGQKLAGALKKVKLRLSVLDLSNAWWSNYIKPAQLDSLIRAIDPIAANDSLALLTTRNGRDERELYRWEYLGFSYKSLRDRRLLDLFGYFGKFPGEFMPGEAPIVSLITGKTNKWKQEWTEVLPIMPLLNADSLDKSPLFLTKSQHDAIEKLLKKDIGHYAKIFGLIARDQNATPDWIRKTLVYLNRQPSTAVHIAGAINRPEFVSTDAGINLAKDYIRILGNLPLSKNSVSGHGFHLFLAYNLLEPRSLWANHPRRLELVEAILEHPNYAAAKKYRKEWKEYSLFDFKDFEASFFSDPNWKNHPDIQRLCGTARTFECLEQKSAIKQLINTLKKRLCSQLPS